MSLPVPFSKMKCERLVLLSVRALGNNDGQQRGRCEKEVPSPAVIGGAICHRPRPPRAIGPLSCYSCPSNAFSRTHLFGRINAPSLKESAAAKPSHSPLDELGFGVA